MDIEYFTRGEKLNQDEFSLSSPTFGEEGQLKVVGWFGKRGSDKYYILHCRVCAEDKELHGGGYFRSLKFSLYKKKPQIPCGCSGRYSYTEGQQRLRVERACKELGLSFIGWEGDFKKGETRSRLFCREHGEFVSGRISHIVDEGKGCRACGDKEGAIKRTKDSDYFIQMFLDSGHYIEGTLFRQCGKVGTARLWEVVCGKCGDCYATKTVSIVAGKKQCSCNNPEQRFLYIFNVVDEKGNVVAIKFGVSSDPKLRAAQQQRKTTYKVEVSDVFEFKTSYEGRKLEEAFTGLSGTPRLKKEEYPDGFTETTKEENREEIIKICLESGAVRVDLSEIP